MFALGDYTVQGFQLGMENLYQPILSSMKNFGKDIQLAPVPTIESMYGNLGYSQINNYSAPNYELLSGVVSNYNRSNAETNALLRELLAAVRQGQKIEVNGRELGRTVRSEASEYFRMIGKPYFAFQLKKLPHCDMIIKITVWEVFLWHLWFALNVKKKYL